MTACLVVCCSEDVSKGLSYPVVDVSEDQRFDDMLNIKSSGLKSFLGTDNELAKAKERTLMKVSFDYDFSIGRHEVTCGEFRELMGDKVDVECESKSLPVANVTFYDAVLFANARSRKEKLDTVYSYNGAEMENGHCVNMTGFVFHPDKGGFRLPTEAEWTLAASKNWNAKGSWNSANSDYKAHEVCSASKSISSNSLCDMAGNVMEWVNDWLSYFRDTTVANFVGAPDGGSLGERVVKGGSFRNEASAMNLYSRGDVYTVTSSTKADYVGFRLAMGPIFDAAWMSSNGSISSSPVAILANSRTMRSLTGTYQVKLAFRNDESENLTFVDYSNGVLTATEIQDTLSVYHPEISPDGKWVAFSTKYEGVKGKSKLYVRKLNASGDSLVSLDVESAVIPRWRVLNNKDTAIVYVTDAGDNSFYSDFFEKSTWQVPFAKGKFGTPEKLLDGAFHGGVSADNQFAVTGSKLFRSLNSKDSLWYEGFQACNVSLFQDGTNRSLFLDLGNGPGKSFTGDSLDYESHKYLLVMDSLGTLIQGIAAPEGFTFDHTEWVWSNYVVATLTNDAYAHRKIVLVNLEDSSVVDLVEGEELWHPHLWVGRSILSAESSKLNADSAGAYLLESSEEGPQILRYKMELLWRFKDWANVVVIGSSRALDGVTPSSFGSEFYVLNLAQTPNSIFMSRDMLNNYVYPHVDNLKYVILSLDLDFWYKMENHNFFYEEYKSYPGYVYDKNHGYWTGGYPEGLLEYTEKSLGVETGSIYTEDIGHVNTPCVSWGERAEVEMDSNVYKGKSYLEHSLAVLKDMIETADNNNVVMVGVIFPQHPGYQKTGAFGRYGLQRSLAEKLTEDLKDLEKTYPNFVLVDENKMGDHDYGDEMALDYDHLCQDGAKKISVRLDSLLRTMN